jgi:S-DNA-T family DNA segregation ATPase FtsK/SpoIIIE
MWNRQGLSRYGLSLTLAFAVVYVALAVFGYDPADPPTTSVAPANAVPTNPCGPIGASLAHHSLEMLGWSIVVPLAGAASATLLLLRQRALSGWVWGSAGLPPLTLAAAAGLSRWLPELEPSTPVGPGGFIGTGANLFLEAHLGKFGATLSIVACALLGLNLAWEFLVLWPVAEINSLLRWPARWKAIASRLKPKFEFSRAAAPVQGRAPASAVPIHRASNTPVPAQRPALSTPAPNFSSASRVRSTQPAIGGPPLPAGMPVGNLPLASPKNPPVSAPPASRNTNYLLPPFSILDPPAVAVQENEDRLQERAQVIEQTIAEFGHQVRVVQIDTGPVITQFEIELEAGLRVSRIVGLGDDLARALAVQNVRIIAPIPGKSTVGIEVPNDRRGVVKINEIIERIGDRIDRMRIPLFLGKDVKGNALSHDLADMPHLLIAGRTGTGKSVCLNAMIISILMTKRPDEVKLLLIDPKMVELSQFKQIPHLMHPVVTDMKKAESLLAWACEKMDERYAFLARVGVRNIQTYNMLGAEEIYARLRPEDPEEQAKIPTFMPYIVIIADEMADLMMTAPKEVENHIVRLAQKARAVGMHLILATQKPTVDVITGLIKGNLPARIAFQVTSRGDSRVILDEMGADRLLGMGDMLFLVPGTSHLIRSQGTYVSDAEVTNVCDFLSQYPQEFSKELVQLQMKGGAGGKSGEALKQRDEVYEAAIEVVIREQRGSTSLLQRALGIGYGRAARLIDYMYEDGIVGEYKSGSAREVLYSWDDWEAMKSGGGDDGPTEI